MSENKQTEGSRYKGVNYSVLVGHVGHLAVTIIGNKQNEWFYAFFTNQKSMIQKKIIGLLTVFMLTIPTVSFISCSNDDDNSEIEASTNKSEAKMFVGTWSGYGIWTFKEDGTCSYTYNTTSYGHWSYSDESKTLITDVMSWNWQILAISENSWTGTHLAGRKNTHTYTRIE